MFYILPNFTFEPIILSATLHEYSHSSLVRQATL